MLYGYFIGPEFWHSLKANIPEALPIVNYRTKGRGHHFFIVVDIEDTEAYLCLLTGPPLQLIYMLNRDQTIWVTTEVLLGTRKGRQWGTVLEPDGNTLGTSQPTPPPTPKPNRKKYAP